MNTKYGASNNNNNNSSTGYYWKQGLTLARKSAGEDFQTRSVGAGIFCQHKAYQRIDGWARFGLLAGFRYQRSLYINASSSLTSRI